MLLVVGVHECGHYFAAKYLNVGIKRLSIGLGRPLYKAKRASGVEVAWGWLPLGGYVSLIDEREGQVKEEDLPYAFNRKPAWVRAIILAAGPAMSLVLAVGIFTLLFWVGIQATKPLLGEVKEGGLAFKAGLKKHDEILSVGGWRTSNLTLVLLSLVSHVGDKTPLKLTVKNSEGKIEQHYLNIRDWKLEGAFPKPLVGLGIALDKSAPSVIYKYPLAAAFKEGLYQTSRYIALNTLVLLKILQGKLSFRALAGPMVLFSAAQGLLLQNVVLFLQFVALLSIAVGIVNLLPMPGLDGGHLFLLLIEKLRGKPLSVAAQVLLYRLSIAILIVLFFQLLANDLYRLSYNVKP